MPALSYSKKNIEKYDFENKILQGIKKHTIRRYGPRLTKRPFKIGDTLSHYINWRTSQVKKICKNKCLYVADIEIYKDMCNIFCIKINNHELDITQIIKLALNDGFNHAKQFKNYFIKAGLPFHGQIIGWIAGIVYE